MSYALHYREELAPAVVKELDDMVAYFNDHLSKALDSDGNILPAALIPPPGTDVEGEEHWWRNGPWTFDDPQAVDANKAGIHPPGLPAGTYNDWAPAGIDDCIIIEIGIAGGGGVTFTGMKAPSPVRKRLVLFVNGDSGGSVTIKHANTASQPQNRFSLPNSQDIVIAPKQNVMLYYSLQRAAWTAAITPTLSGGLYGAGSTTGGGNVVGPASATDSNVAVFDGTTGKLIKDGGQTIAQIIAAAGGGVWTISTTNVTALQLKTLQSAPITIAAAPGSGLGYIVGSVAVAVTQSVAGNAGTWRVQASGVLGIDYVTNMPNDLNNGRNKVFERPGIDFGAVGANVTNMRNKALLFIADADPASAGDATAIVTVVYRSIAWPA